MLHWLSQAFSTYVLHPEHGNGYQWHSGIGSDISEVTLIGLALGWWKHKNCHVKGCWRPGHPDPEHGQPVCRKHRGRRLEK